MRAFGWLALVLTIAVAHAADQNSLRFIAFGDWGGQSDSPYTTVGELSLAAQLPNSIRANDTQFILAIGDNFYSDGVRNVNDKRFEETFEKVFTAPETQLPWYVVAGNHDHNGNTSAQIDYSSKSSRWRFPSLYYTFTETVQADNGNFSVQFIMIDTVKLDEGDSLQLSWIETQLQNSITNNVDWVFMAGHYPVWSVAEHGSTPSLQKAVKPLLDKYKVAAYFCGHDHDLQHIQTSENVGYYLTGSGHTAEYNQDHLSTVPAGALKFYWPPDNNPPVQSGYIVVQVRADELLVDYMDSLGDVLYSVSQPNPRSAFKQGPMYQLRREIKTSSARVNIAVA